MFFSPHQRDPFGTVAELTDEQRTLYQEQTVPKLTELLDLASEHQINVLFDLRPPPEGHPYQVNFVEYTKEKLIEYGLEETEMVSNINMKVKRQGFQPPSGPVTMYSKNIC